MELTNTKPTIAAFKHKALWKAELLVKFKKFQERFDTQVKNIEALEQANVVYEAINSKNVRS